LKIPPLLGKQEYLVKMKEQMRRRLFNIKVGWCKVSGVETIAGNEARQLRHDKLSPSHYSPRRQFRWDQVLYKYGQVEVIPIAIAKTDSLLIIGAFDAISTRHVFYIICPHFSVHFHDS
jgi:hypothetical protein